MIGHELLALGAVQVTVACALPAVALTLVGAPGAEVHDEPVVPADVVVRAGDLTMVGAAGGTAGVTALEAVEARPVPAMFVAVTVNV